MVAVALFTRKTYPVDLSQRPALLEAHARDVEHLLVLLTQDGCSTRKQARRIQHLQYIRARSIAVLEECRAGKQVIPQELLVRLSRLSAAAKVYLAE